MPPLLRPTPDRPSHTAATETLASAAPTGLPGASSPVMLDDSGVYPKMGWSPAGPRSMRSPLRPSLSRPKKQAQPSRHQISVARPPALRSAQCILPARASLVAS
ncbi:hypothetical protein GY45DRAFT_917702 [Cubamyces sp. BRFM 1775]|nr:hypothetical protein GY45DRAFT_917702 [Cubamyces sp. BRFM 1775]